MKVSISLHFFTPTFFGAIWESSPGSGARKHFGKQGCKGAVGAAAITRTFIKPLKDIVT